LIFGCPTGKGSTKSFHPQHCNVEGRVMSSENIPAL